MRRILPSLAALAGIVLLCLPACSTGYTLSDGKRYLYGGTRENIVAFAPTTPPRIERDPGVRQVLAVFDPAFSLAYPAWYVYPPDPYGGLRRFGAFLDFPFSLALDTICLPVTLPLQIIHGDR